MPPRPADKRPPKTRHTYEDVVLEIRLLLNRAGTGSQKEAAAAAGLTPSQFSKRMVATWEKGERFRIEHLGALALWANAPRGWPLIPWAHAEELDKRSRSKK